MDDPRISLIRRCIEYDDLLRGPALAALESLAAELAARTCPRCADRAHDDGPNLSAAV